MLGCCSKIQIIQQNKKIQVLEYTYNIRLIFCKNCGELKSTTHIEKLNEH